MQIKPDFSAYERKRDRGVRRNFRTKSEEEKDTWIKLHKEGFMINTCRMIWWYDCNITKFCFVTEWNECEVQPVFSGPGQLRRYGGLLRDGLSGGRILLGGKICRTRPDCPWNPPSFQYYRHRVCFPPPPSGEGRITPLSPFWFLMACSRVNFTFTLPYPVLHRLFVFR